MSRYILLYLLLATPVARAQTCQLFNRKFFHLLPQSIPEFINCTDAQGNKQGWWISYNVSYNKWPIPDERDSGYYVDNYNFGQYKDNRKTGKWMWVDNGHVTMITRTDSIYTRGDTNVVETLTEGWEDRYRYVEFLADSSYLKAYVVSRTSDTIFIHCKQGYCKMYHDTSLLQHFSTGNFEINFLTAFEQMRRKEEESKFSAPRKGR